MKHTAGEVVISSSALIVDSEGRIVANTFSMQGLEDIQPEHSKTWNGEEWNG